MKNDVHSVSQCVPGTENYESFIAATNKKEYTQYDYRTAGGQLFSCIAPTLEKCREKRKLWQKFNDKAN